MCTLAAEQMARCRANCSGYILVAWIWALLFYVPLDPIKWVMLWILNEENLRKRVSGFLCSSVIAGALDWLSLAV